MRSPSSTENSRVEATPTSFFQRYRGRIRILLYSSLLIYVYLGVRNLHWQDVSPDNLEMSPILQPGFSALLYRKGDADYKPGDIIYLLAPGNDRHRFMEVIAADSGHVRIDAGKIFVDGTEKISPVLPAHVNRQFPGLKPGELFCVCSNQSTDARDSITQGPFQKNGDIRGKVFYLPQEHKPDSP